MNQGDDIYETTEVLEKKVTNKVGSILEIFDEINDKEITYTVMIKYLKIFGIVNVWKIIPGCQILINGLALHYGHP